MSTNSTVVTRDRSALWITINRPDDLNSLTPDVIAGLNSACDEVEKDQNIRALIITGSAGGTAENFSVGMDIEFLGKCFADIDGVFIQRFTAGFKNEKIKNNLNKVFDNCFIASKNNNRLISVMYDLSGSKPGDVVQNTINDWKQLVDKYKLNNPNNPNILTYKSNCF